MNAARTLVSEKPAMYRVGVLEVPVPVLKGLLDGKAEAGEMFSVEEARLDIELRPEATERVRAERWGWSRRQVRNLLTTGTASPARRTTGRTKADQSGPRADQESPQTMPQTQKADHERTKADQDRTKAAPISSVTPPPPTGAAPPGGPDRVVEAIAGQVEAIKAEAERLAAERAAAEKERRRLAAERKRAERGPVVADAPPTPADVAAFAAEASLPPEYAEAFVDHYAGQGWKRKGGVLLTDWKRAYRLWCRNEEAWGRSRPKRAPQPKISLSTPVPERLMPRALADYPGLTRDAFFRNGRDTLTGEPLWMAHPQRLKDLGIAPEASHA